MLVGCFGQILATLAALTCALGVADVVVTMQTYCSPWSSANYCSTGGEPYVWTWIAVGIWGSLPIFLTGLYGICVGTDHVKWRCYSLLLFLSAVVFAPAIVVLSAIELWRGSASQWNFYSFSGGSLSPGNIYPNPNPYQAKFAIPLVVAILGGLMFFMTGYYTWMLCCCMNQMGISAPSSNVVIREQSAAPVTVVRSQPQVYSSPVYSSPVSSCQPCNRFTAAPTRYASGFSNFQSSPGRVFYSR